MLLDHDCEGRGVLVSGQSWSYRCGYPCYGPGGQNQAFREVRFCYWGVQAPEEVLRQKIISLFRTFSSTIPMIRQDCLSIRHQFYMQINNICNWGRFVEKKSLGLHQADGGGNKSVSCAKSGKEAFTLFSLFLVCDVTRRS